MESKNTIAVFAIIIMVMALVNLSVTYIKINDFRKEVSGFAASEIAYVNITILQTASINITNRTLDWAEGAVDEGNSNATLYTNGTANATVDRGNWSTVNKTGMIIENIGGVNASLAIESSAANDFIGGSVPQFRWKISDKDPGACTANSTYGVFTEVNESGDEIQVVCSPFDYNSNVDEIFLDFLITVPADTPNHSAAGTRVNSTITVSAEPFA